MNTANKIKIVLKLGTWSHHANEKFCFDRIYFLGLSLPLCVRHPRLTSYFRSGNSSWLGFSFQRITFLGILVLSFFGCQNPTESSKPKTDAVPHLCNYAARARDAGLEPSIYTGLSTFEHDSLFLTFTESFLKIETKPPKKSDGTFPYSHSQNDFKVCYADTCIHYAAAPDKFVIWGATYQLWHRSGPHILIHNPTTTSIQEPKPRTPQKGCNE